jgi:hypothetical protein
MLPRFRPESAVVLAAVETGGNDVQVVFPSSSGVSAAAPAVSAACKCGGNVRPLFAARRIIPRQAFALKKYFSGISPVSNTRDKEHTVAPLWNAEVFSVKNAVGEPIPEFRQVGQHLAEISPCMRLENSLCSIASRAPAVSSGPLVVQSNESSEGRTDLASAN